jgi:hypothetical protein
MKVFSCCSTWYEDFSCATGFWCTGYPGGVCAECTDCGEGRIVYTPHSRCP